MKDPCVYILASGTNGTLDVGLTSDLATRLSGHTLANIDSFTKKYGVNQLVYYEHHVTMTDAIRREHSIKRWRRLWKIRRIEGMNPEWKNLFDASTGEIAFGTGDREASAEPIDPNQE